MARHQLVQMLEREVAAIRRYESSDAGAGGRPHDRLARIDSHYRRILDLLRPRIAWLIRRYGLSPLKQDAEQACAIGIMRAVRAWDPERASFATLAHWQMRGELQSLRHRMMPDLRQGARAGGVRTVSWHNRAGRERTEAINSADDAALAVAERGASDAMARNLIERLLGKLASPVHERRIVADAIFAETVNEGLDRRTRERNRQIARRTFRNCRKAIAG